MSRTLLIGLDGATFTVLDRLMDAGVMPNLRAFCARGARADLLSTPNPLTPAAWTSLLTGRSPGNHGVFDFIRVEDLSYHPQFRLATSSDVQCETIWSMLGRQGKRSIALNFPVMFPPRPMEGFMIPGFVPHRHLRQAMYPRGLYERLKKLPQVNLQEIAVDFEEERRSVQVMERERYEEWVRFHIRRERNWGEVLCHLMETEEWDLAAVVFDGTDKLQHICWRFIDDDLFSATAASDWERTVRELCLDYFRQLDDMIARLLELAGPDTSVFLASDHGFGPSDEIFYVNTWLAEQGELTWKDGVPLAAAGMLNTEGMKTPAFLFDWDHTRAYALTPGCNGIYLRLGPPGSGEEPGARAALARQLTEALHEVKNPATGEPVVRRVMPREEVFAGDNMHLAPDLTLVLRDYGFVSVLRSDVAVRSRDEIVGAHRPEGIFLAGGPGIRAGARTEALSIMDVTPALMYRLGLPIPSDFEGQLPTSILEPAQLEARPPVHAAAGPSGTVPPPPSSDAPTLDAEGEEALYQRLKSLGYVE